MKSDQQHSISYYVDSNIISKTQDSQKDYNDVRISQSFSFPILNQQTLNSFRQHVQTYIARYHCQSLNRLKTVFFINASSVLFNQAYAYITCHCQFIFKMHVIVVMHAHLPDANKDYFLTCLEPPINFLLTNLIIAWK